MSDEKIAEIKERHEFISSRTAAFFFPETAWTAHEDRATLLAEVERLTRERDEARAEVALLLLESEVLAKHEGSPGREWHSGGAWLYPGDTINVVRAPLPAMEAKP